MNAQLLGKFALIALDGPGTFIFTYAFDHFPRNIVTNGRSNWSPQEVTTGVQPLFYGNRSPLQIRVDELWLDKTETNESVRPEISALLALQVERANEGTPPVLLAIWGENQERVVLEEVNVEEQFFTPTGDPLRARVSLVLLEMQEESTNTSIKIKEDFEP